MPTMVPVKSSNVRSAAFDGDVLVLEFRNGRRYRYRGVSAIEYERLLKAKSKTGYLRNRIWPWHGKGEEVRE